MAILEALTNRITKKGIEMLKDPWTKCIELERDYVVELIRFLPKKLIFLSFYGLIELFSKKHPAMKQNFTFFLRYLTIIQLVVFHFHKFHDRFVEFLILIY